MPEIQSGNFETSRYLMDSAARLSLKNRIQERLLGLFSTSPDLERLHNDIIDIAMEAIPCDAGSVFRAGKKGELVVVAARGRVADQLIGLTLKRGQGIAGASGEDRRVIPVSDVGSDPRHAAEVAQRLGFETRSLLAVPMVSRGEMMGVVELINKRGSNEFQRHEIELVERVARSAGDALLLLGQGWKGAKGKRR